MACDRNSVECREGLGLRKWWYRGGVCEDDDDA